MDKFFPMMASVKGVFQNDYRLMSDEEIDGLNPEDNRLLVKMESGTFRFTLEPFLYNVRGRVDVDEEVIDELKKYAVHNIRNHIYGPILEQLREAYKVVRAEGSTTGAEMIREILQDDEVPPVTVKMEAHDGSQD